jgi:branched-subunit amino acid transport protein
MTERLALIGLLAIAVFGVRLAGFIVPSERLPGIVLRALRVAPVAVFAALVSGPLTSATTNVEARLIASVVAALVARRWTNLWGCVASGMAVYWLLLWL